MNAQIRRNRWSSLSVLLLALLIPACSAFRTGERDPDTQARLEVTYGQIRYTPESISLSVSIRNPKSEAVRGVRVLYRIMTSKSETATELGRVEKEFPDTNIEPGSVARVELSLPEIIRVPGVSTFLSAHAMQLGSTTFGPPKEWKGAGK